MTKLGCCGQSRVSLRGMISEADTYPANTARGRVARQKLAYAVAAGRAAQIGNKVAYSRAMNGLGSLGGLGTFTAGSAAFSTAAARVTAAAHAATATPTPVPAASLGSQLSTYTSLVAGLINIGTSIARTAGGDPNVTAAIDMVVGWLRAILTGSSTVTIPTLTPDLLNGLADFCAHKDQIQNPIDLGLTAIASVVRGVGIASRDTGAQAAADAIDLVRGRAVGLLNSLCTAVVAAGGVAPVDCSSIAHAVYDAAQGGCVCGPNFMASPTVADTCIPAPVVFVPTGGSTTTYIPTVFHPAAAKSSIVVPAAAAAAALWWFLK